jgi:hypothetical protein
MRAAVVSLVILAGALVSSAQAGTANLWFNANCPGTADSKEKFSSGKCIAGEDSDPSVSNTLYHLLWCLMDDEHLDFQHDVQRTVSGSHGGVRCLQITSSSTYITHWLGTTLA